MTKKNVLVGLWAIMLLSLALAIASSGMPTPLQSMEWEVLQSLQQDGVKATSIYCGQMPSDSNTLWTCGVSIADAPGTTVDVHWFEDGSWRFTDHSRP
jgi:hypothetical protein